MGRIKTQFIKRVTQKLLERHPTDFTTDYTTNKEVVTRFAKVPSKKIRNVIAGYASRLVKMRQAKSLE